MIFKFFLLLCVAASFVPCHCEEKTFDDDTRSRLPEFLTELDVASAEASVEDVEALRKIVKRLAPEKNGEYLGIRVYFANKNLLKKWLKRAEITGQPGVDYPALTTIPSTSFSCRGQKGGYYADLDTNCQVFHICDNGRKISFLCPNGTIFQQSQLICDWWFKVDCSKSAELYEQSAEFFAEEERKRIEKKKMTSEFHRASGNEDNSDRFFQNSNYDGRQNGRQNPYGQSAVQNQLPNGQGTKSTAPYDPNQVYNRQSTRTQSTSQYHQDTAVNRAKDEYSKPPSSRQQNQLLSNDEEKSNHDQRGSSKYYNNQAKASQEDEYYGSAANVNAQQSVKSSKPRAFTRQNFNGGVQKVTPSYTEATTFRTSTTTVSPIREFQHLAESAAFASSRGNRYKAHSSNQFNSFYSNNKATTSAVAAVDTVQQQSTATTTVSSSKDRISPHSFVRSRIPAFPGPTFTPIYKPRTTTVPPTTTTQRPYTNTDYFKQNYHEQTTTTNGNYETTTLYPDFTTTDSSLTYTTSAYRDRNTNAAQTTFNSDRYTTTVPTTRQYFTRDFYRETTTIPPFTTTTANYDSGEFTTRYTDNYSGSFTTVRPVYKGAQNQNTVSPSNFEESGTTTPVTVYADDIQAQDSARFGSSKLSTKNPVKSQSTYQQNFISGSTEKPNRNNASQTFDSGIPRRTLSPYDSSVTYQQGKIASTLPPYVPFTKNYAFTTTKKPNYTPASSNYIQNIKKSENYVQSNFGKSGNRATYLPEKTTQPSIAAEKSILDSRPANEREHALSMLKSLQGLEGNVPNLNLNNYNNTRAGLDVPVSSGPSTLHSLALYFANADDDENYDNKKPIDSAINVEYFETTPNPIARKNTSVIDLPASILTQHTISSYAELFNLNNALENNITGDQSYDNSDENLTDEDSDLDIQQSEGPLSGIKKSNNTKLRELAQVFTQALSAYLQDPDTFKKVLTEIRPTEPPQSENEITTQTTTEDYPSVTKEKDEVLDFSDDNNGVRRRRPTTTPLPETTKDDGRETTYQPYYTPDYFTTTTQYPDESLNEAQSSYGNQGKVDKKLSYLPNNINDIKKLNEVQNYKSTTNSIRSSSDPGKEYENYFPSEPSRYGGFQNNSASSYTPYGKYVKPLNSTPISDNYIASSTPATYEVAAPQSQSFTPSKSSTDFNDRLREDLTPPAIPSYQTSNTIHSIPTSTTQTRPVNAGTSSSHVTPVYKRPQESVTTTREPFRIRYYDTTTPQQQQSENLVTASSIHSNFGNNFGTDNRFRETERPVNTQTHSNNQNNHWTSSPTVTQLWETTVFIDPDHINRGLDNDPRITQASNVDFRSTTTSSRDDFLNSDISNSVTPQNFLTDPSTPWQWASNNNDAPTAFTLLPNAFRNTEYTATPTPTYTTKSSITTTLTTSITATNAIPPRDQSIPTRISVFNVTENEIEKAHQMFGSLNETSSKTLMKVMKQADNNATVRQLVLLLISHCNGPMNKTMEEEKEQLLNALLRMPVNEFTTEESQELIKGISTLHLPIGRSTIESRSPATTTITTTTTKTTTTPTSTLSPREPAVTTFRSRSGRKFKTTTASPIRNNSNKAVARSDRASTSTKNLVPIDEATASDTRALDLLRSLYTIAAKWG